MPLGWLAAGFDTSAVLARKAFASYFWEASSSQTWFPSLGWWQTPFLLDWLSLSEPQSVSCLLSKAALIEAVRHPSNSALTRFHSFLNPDLSAIAWSLPGSVSLSGSGLPCISKRWYSSGIRFLLLLHWGCLQNSVRNNTLWDVAIKEKLGHTVIEIKQHILKCRFSIYLFFLNAMITIFTVYNVFNHYNECILWCEICYWKTKTRVPLVEASFNWWKQSSNTVDFIQKR